MAKHEITKLRVVRLAGSRRGRLPCCEGGDVPGPGLHGSHEWLHAGQFLRSELGGSVGLQRAEVVEGR